jgi:endonuclease/exonuclease/phosphatase family metal-dependent hydrolase
MLFGPADPQHLHLMSFNIRMASGETRPGDSDHWPDRAPLLDALLRAEQPTLLGIQEGTYPQLPVVQRALPGHRMVGFGREGGSAGEHAAIFFDAERLRLEAWDQLWLSDTPRLVGSRTWGNQVTRILTWARFRDMSTGTVFAHVNTHFDHEVEGARVRSAGLLAGLVTDAELAELPILVTGDFNSPAHSPAWQALVARGPLVDLWETADRRVTPAWGSFPDYGPPVEGADRIDWMLASPDVLAEKIGIGAVPEGLPAPSDHAPLHALIRLG